MTATALRPRSTTLAALAVTGAATGFLLVATPIDLCFLGAPLGLVAGLGWAWEAGPARARPLPLLAYLAGIAVGTSPLLFRTPFGEERVGPFPATTVTIDEVARAIEADTGHPVVVPDEAGDVSVELPGRTSTIREIQQAIQEQTAYRLAFFGCGTGATLLHPVWIGHGWIDRAEEDRR